MSTMIKFAKGRFLVPAKIISANIYDKVNPGNDASEGKPFTEFRVAITTSDIDAETNKNMVYFSDPFPSHEAAEKYILNGFSI